MASITLTIPDVQLPRVRAALCIAAGLPDTAPNAKLAVIQLIQETVRAVEHGAARQAQPPVPVPDVTGIVT